MIVPIYRPLLFCRSKLFIYNIRITTATCNWIIQTHHDAPFASIEMKAYKLMGKNFVNEPYSSLIIRYIHISILIIHSNLD